MDMKHHPPEGGSKGANTAKIEVPNVKGFSWDQARSRLESVGLKAEKKEVEVEGREDNTVISQNPSAGKMVDRGSLVSLEISRKRKESLDNVKTIGGGIGSLYISDIRYGDHSDKSEFWIVFEIYRYDGSICNDIPYVKAGWDAAAGGIKVSIKDVKESADVPFPGQVEYIEGKNRDLAGVVRSISGLSPEGDSSCYLIRLTRKCDFKLEYSFTTEYSPNPTVKVIIKVIR
jgi:hypothetical protein